MKKTANDSFHFDAIIHRKFKILILAFFETLQIPMGTDLAKNHFWPIAISKPKQLKLATIWLKNKMFTPSLNPFMKLLMEHLWIKSKL